MIDVTYHHYDFITIYEEGWCHLFCIFSIYEDFLDLIGLHFSIIRAMSSFIMCTTSIWKWCNVLFSFFFWECGDLGLCSCSSRSSKIALSLAYFEEFMLREILLWGGALTAFCLSGENKIGTGVSSFLFENVCLGMGVDPCGFSLYLFLWFCLVVVISVSYTHLTLPTT